MRDKYNHRQTNQPVFFPSHVHIGNKTEKQCIGITTAFCFDIDIEHLFFSGNDKGSD